MLQTDTHGHTRHDPPAQAPTSQTLLHDRAVMPALRDYMCALRGTRRALRIARTDAHMHASPCAAHGPGCVAGVAHDAPIAARAEHVRHER